MLIAAALLFFMQGNPIVPPPVPPPNVTVRNEVTVQAPPPDPEVIADASVQSVQAIVVQLVAPTLAGWANDALSIADIYRQTPPEWSYANSAVRAMAGVVVAIALGLLALAIFAAGTGHALGQGASYGRLIYGALLSVGNLVWWELGITLNNAINDAIAAPGLPEIVRPHLALPLLTTNPIEAFGPAVLVIVYAVVAILLIISLAFRLALIDVLIVIGSLALLCKATEQSDSFAQRYQTLAIGTLFSQVLIVVCLRLAPILGGIGSGIVGTLLGIVVLLLARKMPSMLASDQAGRTGGGLFRMIVLRRFFLR